MTEKASFDCPMGSLISVPKLVFNLAFFLLRRKRRVLAKKMNATARM